MKILALKTLLIAKVSGGLFHHYLPKIHQKVKNINLTDDSKIISSDEELCETFNQFFDVVPTLNIPKPKSFPTASDNLDPIMSVIKSFDKHPSIVKIKPKGFDSTFHFRKTSCNEVEKIIINLNIKKSCQQEGIPTKIIKLNKDLIAKFIAETSNSCIDEGEFPSELKHAVIVPVHKKKDKSDKSNCRPVSVISNYSKVYGKLIYNQLYLYFENIQLYCINICILTFQVNVDCEKDTAHSTVS